MLNPRRLYEGVTQRYSREGFSLSSGSAGLCSGSTTPLGVVLTLHIWYIPDSGSTAVCTAPSRSGTTASNTAGSTVGEAKPTDIPPVPGGTSIVLPPVLELNGSAVVPLPVTVVPLLELHGTSSVVPLSTSVQYTKY